jgi:hypothetical protein
VLLSHTCLCKMHHSPRTYMCCSLASHLAYKMHHLSMPHTSLLSRKGLIHLLAHLPSQAGRKAATCTGRSQVSGLGGTRTRALALGCWGAQGRPFYIGCLGC